MLPSPNASSWSRSACSNSLGEFLPSVNSLCIFSFWFSVFSSMFSFLTLCNTPFSALNLLFSACSFDAVKHSGLMLLDLLSEKEKYIVRARSIGLFQSLPEESSCARPYSSFYSSGDRVERANSILTLLLVGRARPSSKPLPAPEGHAPLPISSGGSKRGVSSDRSSIFS